MINKTKLISFIKIYKLQNNNILNNFKENFYKSISKIKKGQKSQKFFLETISENFKINN